LLSGSGESKFIIEYTAEAQSHPDPLPSLLTDKSGPLKQRSLLEWNIPGNLYAGDNIASPGSSRILPASAGTISPQSVRKARDICVIPEENLNHPISLDTDDEEGHPFDHMGHDVGDEDDGGEGEDEDEDQHLDSEHAVKHKRQTLSHAVKDQYEKHLKYLKQTPYGSKPYLYEVHHIFWLPHQANFFILSRPNKPRPSQLYNYRWFYWDPDHLVEGGLKCPNCNAHLHHHGFTWPRHVVDLQNVFYMIGQCYHCPQCKNPKSNEKTITFNS